MAIDRAAGGRLNVTARLTGNLEADLEKFATKTIEKILFSGVAAMAKPLYEEVLMNTSGARGHPYIHTGNLHSAMRRVFVPERSTEEKKTYHVTWNHRIAPHGHLIEFGSSRHPAYPFMRPAFAKIGVAIDAGKKRMAERMKDET